MSTWAILAVIALSGIAGALLGICRAGQETGEK